MRKSAEISGEVFDYVVVGGGTAGSIVARRLAENPSFRVCLIEAGPPDEGNMKVLDLTRWAELLRTELDYDYDIEPQERGNSLMRHSRGKVLGGCSSHNSGIAFLAPDADLRLWEQATGSKDWGPKGLIPYFEKLQSKVTLRTVSEDNELNVAFVSAAKEAGFPQLAFNSKDFRENFRDSVGYFQLNAIGSDRCSSSRAYLHPLTELPDNLRVITNTTVTKVVFDHESTAVAVITDNGMRIGIKREVILSAGAFDTPKLLLLSGIGPAWHLREMGIECIADVPGVGEHLVDHPEGVVIWEITKEIPSPVLQRYEVGVFATTPSNQHPEEGPDLMFHFGLEPFDINTAPRGYPTHKNAVSLTPNVTRAKSQGTVRLRSANWQDKPRIDFRYFTDKEGNDEAVMVEGVKLARKLMSMPSMKAWIKTELAPGLEVQTDQDISEYVRTTGNTVYHPAGTCKIGTLGDPLTVVGPDLCVRGVKGIRVADASIFPSMISVNPCLTVMACAEKCAALIASQVPTSARL